MAPSHAATSTWSRFASGTAGAYKFPKQGSTTPWRLHQNYARDILMLRRGALDDGAMEYSNAGSPIAVAERLAA